MYKALNCKKVDVHEVHLLQKISKATFFESFADENTIENLLDYFEKAFSIPSLIDQINNENSCYYFVYDSDELAGYFKINFEDSQTEIKGVEGLELERIYLFHKVQSKGIGNFILNMVVDIARKTNKLYVWLGVWEKNGRAINFYQNFGFKKFDEHIYPIGDDPQTDWMMRLDL